MLICYKVIASKYEQCTVPLIGSICMIYILISKWMGSIYNNNNNNKTVCDPSHHSCFSMELKLHIINDSVLF